MAEVSACREGVDLEALREKYRAERARRIHPGGNRQYRTIEGALAHYVDDPYAVPVERAPIHDTVDVTISGGGFGGLLLGSRLRQIGVDRIRIVEDGGDFGGVWYWNRYPGAGCDTEAYIYLPLLDETGYIPTEKYVKGPEILSHARRIAEHFDLYRDSVLQTKVTSVTWSEEDLYWTVTTDRGDSFTSRFVCMTAGAMIKPKLPGVRGIETFAGHSFHTSRWDSSYTGGDNTGNLTGLRDKVVGIVGTGCTGVQCIPLVAESAKHLYVFQRTPSAINVRANRLTDPDWAASLRPGWQRERMENFSIYVAGGEAETDLVNDGWTAIYRLRSLSGGVLDEVDDFHKMEEIRARVDSVVQDPTVADALKPWYRALCKRPVFHDEYLDTFNRPNVTLVDTEGAGVEEITPGGAVVNGIEYPLDCLIFASGFAVGAQFARRLGYEVTGKGGRTLSEKFAGGMSTLYGMQTSGFPNFFIVAMNQVGISSNQTHVLDVQSRHISAVIGHALKRGARTVDVAVEAEEAWVRTVIEASRANIEFLRTCTPGYYNNEGNPNLDGMRRNGAYAPGIVAFDRIVEAWRSEGSYTGLIFDV